MALADLENTFLGTAGKVGSLNDRRFQQYTADPFTYFSALSGLTPARNYSMQDHRLAYYRALAASPSATLADARRIAWGG